jgi:hypothetical protein
MADAQVSFEIINGNRWLGRWIQYLNHEVSFHKKKRPKQKNPGVTWIACLKGAICI